MSTFVCKIKRLNRESVYGRESSLILSGSSIETVYTKKSLMVQLNQSLVQIIQVSSEASCECSCRHKGFPDLSHIFSLTGPELLQMAMIQCTPNLLSR